jgi:F0F1-type ATP synthase delta subunit
LLILQYATKHKTDVVLPVMTYTWEINAAAQGLQDFRIHWKKPMSDAELGDVLKVLAPRLRQRHCGITVEIDLVGEDLGEVLSHLRRQ